MNRKTLLIAGGTIVVESLAISALAIIIHVKLIEILFLAGVFIFGVFWFWQFGMNRSSNMDKAIIKGETGLKSGDIKLFRFQITPVMLGIISFTLVSFIVTCIYYAPYFIA